MSGKPDWLVWVDDGLRIIQDGLFPPTCLLCDAPGHDGLDLCAGCASSLPYARHVCPRCALALPESAPFAALCGRCQKKAPPYARTIALFHYREPVRHLLHALKFRRRHACARLLGELMATRITAMAGDDALPELIVPVPLHPQRYAERGFNQALELARPLARLLDIPLDTRSCRRIRATSAQTGSTAIQRRRNLRGAFRVVAAPTARHVALVDDVVTTGATVGELARALKRAGVARVDVWCCARA